MKIEITRTCIVADGTLYKRGQKLDADKKLLVTLNGFYNTVEEAPKEAPKPRKGKKKDA